MNPTDKATYENANSSEITGVYSDDHVTVDKKNPCTSSWNKT